jgi:hypothetical protein
VAAIDSDFRPIFRRPEADFRTRASLPIACSSLNSKPAPADVKDSILSQAAAADGSPY